jgi:hypothetical protein
MGGGGEDHDKRGGAGSRAIRRPGGVCASRASRDGTITRRRSGLWQGAVDDNRPRGARTSSARAMTVGSSAATHGIHRTSEKISSRGVRHPMLKRLRFRHREREGHVDAADDETARRCESTTGNVATRSDQGHGRDSTTHHQHTHHLLVPEKRKGNACRIARCRLISRRGGYRSSIGKEGGLRSRICDPRTAACLGGSCGHDTDVSVGQRCSVSFHLQGPGATAPGPCRREGANDPQLHSPQGQEGHA